MVAPDSNLDHLLAPAADRGYITLSSNGRIWRYTNVDGTFVEADTYEGCLRRASGVRARPQKPQTESIDSVAVMRHQEGTV